MIPGLLPWVSNVPLTSREFLVEVRCEVATVLRRGVAVPIIIQVEITATDPVFVKIDAVHAAHEHEPRAPCGAQPVLQGFPIRFRNCSLAHCCADVGSALVCGYIWLSSFLSCISSRSSSRLGTLPPVRLALLASAGRTPAFPAC